MDADDCQRKMKMQTTWWVQRGAKKTKTKERKKEENADGSERKGKMQTL